MLRLILLFPLAGFLFNAFLGKRAGERVVSWVGPASIFFSFATGVYFMSQLAGLGEHGYIRDVIFTWIASGEVSIPFSIVFDHLSGWMVLVVTGVGFLIHVYSIGYMHGDKGYYRYFAYLNLFVFMMLVLVLGSNLLLMFLGWEGVGLCSYLLIGFWFTEEERARAGMKAFIVNRIGDLGFILGIATLLWGSAVVSHPTVEFSQLQAVVPRLPEWVVLAATLLLFVGATGKSAQIPLYVWLPDAMAGPTPVSALIHAATMVTAGVYMVARMNFAYSAAPLAMDVVAGVGVATAFFAATMGLVATDIKKVLAYSTVSQLGYMFVGVGVGAYAGGMFHLTTHAFFKALLFLGAGSVIHGMSGEQDIRKMGGLKDKMPWTYRVFLIEGLALAGIPPFAGFFSKDEILFKAFASGHKLIWAVGIAAAFMTAFYTFRLIFLVFYNTPRYDESVHPHESPPVMIIPMAILAVLSFIGGFVLGFPHHSLIEAFMEGVFRHGVEIHGASGLEMGLMFLSTIVAVAGWAVAYRMYVVDTTLPEKIAQRFKAAYALLFNRYWVDEIYDTLFVKTYLGISDGIMRYIVDDVIIEGFLNTAARTSLGTGRQLRKLQTGDVQAYGFAMLAGVLLVLAYIVWRWAT